jgi:acyl-CoA reductase-like NAD-dependent aldehyde dehydrogenase
MRDYPQVYIDGAWVNPQGGDAIEIDRAACRGRQREKGAPRAGRQVDDADLAKAITESVYRLMMNSGQTCHAPTRLLVPAAKLQQATEFAVQAVRSVKVGDPNGDVYMGPMVSERQWTRFQELIRRGSQRAPRLRSVVKADPKVSRRAIMCARRSSPTCATT